jgi:dTDP-4-dehydrorhamnose reductase
VVPAVSSEARWVAKRPKDSSLGSLHVDTVFKTRRLNLSEAVEKFVSEFKRYEGGG